MAKQVGAFPFVGKMGNVVGQKTRGGYVIRNWVKPSNPQSSLQVYDRQVFTTCSRNWKAIGATAQQAWKDWAEYITSKNPNTPMSKQFEGYCGYTLYMHCNGNIGQTGQVYMDRPPPGFSYDPFTYLGMSTDPSQTAAGELTIDFGFDFVDNGQVYDNYGGFKIKGSKYVQSRGLQFHKLKTLERIDLDGEESSPETPQFTTDLIADDLPCTYLVQVAFIDQCGMSAGLSEIFKVTMEEAIP